MRAAFGFVQSADAFIAVAERGVVLLELVGRRLHVAQARGDLVVHDLAPRGHRDVGVVRLDGGRGDPPDPHLQRLREVARRSSPRCCRPACPVPPSSSIDCVNEFVSSVTACAASSGVVFPVFASARC